MWLSICIFAPGPAMFEVDLYFSILDLWEFILSCQVLSSGEQYAII